MLIAVMTILSAGIPSPAELQAVPAVDAEGLPVALEQADRHAYPLGPGDVLMVVVEGGSTPAALASGLYPGSLCTVSSDGMLGVSGIGMIEASGLTIEEAEQELAVLARRYFPGTRILLSLASPRLVRVVASGAVTLPGTYGMYSLQRVSDLLAACRPASLASRTGVAISGPDSVRFDLRTDPSTRLPVSDPLLAGVDAVFFEFCTSPAFVVSPEGYVGIDSVFLSSVTAWQVDGSLPLRELLESVGGAGVGYDPGRSALVREGVFVPILSDTAGEVMVLPGDTLFLAGHRAVVHVSGAVFAPGEYDWHPGYTELDYMRLAGGTQFGARASGTRVYRNGSEVEDGSIRPGDSVEIPWTWMSNNQGLLVAIASLITAGVAIYNAATKD